MGGVTVKHALTSTSSPPNDILSIPWSPVVLPLRTPLIVINDLEESKSILVDVDAAEFSNFIGCVSNKANEVTAKVCMNLRSVDVGKVVGARSDGSQGDDGAGADTS